MFKFCLTGEGGKRILNLNTFKYMRRFSSIPMLILFAVVGYVLVRTGIYGLTIFAVLPMGIGGAAVWVACPATGRGAAWTGALAVLAGLFLFLLLGMEGTICIFMTAPLALPLGAMGGWMAYRSMASKNRWRGAAAMLMLPPATLTWDIAAPAPEFAVRTELEIAAPPERVWSHVVRFSELPEPKEWYFRAGLAYPRRARIVGEGPGAVRYCEFSTGPFVEPVEVWDEPRLLRFRVTENPAPINEWSPYHDVMPKHLHGYFVSKRGQFRLVTLPGGRTLLEGTTWYRHGLWPAEYWRWWSDAIIHRIHLRVLRHVRMLAEQPG
jgi:hypothetical protein